MRILIVALVLIFSGSYLAGAIQTDNANIEVSDIRFTGANGQTMSALLYRPKHREQPLPAILATHGYINSRETQSGFAIEFARRGFVVLAIDQTGHGYSDPPAFAHGFGGPDGLRYLRSLDFVDTKRIGLEGHSMGGWASLMAAADQPDGYAAMVLEGSSTGSFGAPEGDANFPRNLLLVFSQFDEFSGVMWGSALAKDLVKAEKLKTLFNSQDNIQLNTLYGDINAGTARKLTMPGVIHPADHHSPDAIADAVDWLQQILKPDNPLPAKEQIWHWKELGTASAFLGIFILIFAVFELLLSSEFFKHLKHKPATTNNTGGRSWLISIAGASLIPMLLYFPALAIGSQLIPPNAVWSQSITNGVTLWMLGCALISFISIKIWANAQHAKLRGVIDNHYSGNWQAALLALLVVATLYLTAIIVDIIFVTDFRLWIVALKLLSTSQALIGLSYLPLFFIYFFSLGLLLHGQLRLSQTSLVRALPLNATITTGGMILLLLIQYLPLLSGGTLAIASLPLLTIVALQVAPLVLAVTCISTWCFYRTGSINTGVIINTLFSTWYVVAGQATQTVPWFMQTLP